MVNDPTIPFPDPWGSCWCHPPPAATTQRHRLRPASWIPLDPLLPDGNCEALAAYIEPLAFHRKLIPRAIATRGEPQRRQGGALFALRHCPSTLGLGGDRRLLGQSCATSSLDRDGNKELPAPPRSQAPARSCLAKGERRISGGWWDFARSPPPPGTSLSLYSPSSISHWEHPVLTCTLPRRFGVIQVLLRPEFWEQRPAGEEILHQIHRARRGLYCPPHVEGTGGSFLYSPVELGVPTAPKGLFSHGGGVPGASQPREMSLGIPS